MKYDEYDEIAELDELDPNNKHKKSKREKLLDEIKLIEDDDSSMSSIGFLPSSLLKDSSEKKESKKKKDLGLIFDDNDDWIKSIMNIKVSKSKCKRGDLFEFEEGKKKKKKKKKKGELTDYNKEFETEAALIKNLLQDQSRFTDSLQQEYDKIKSTKSTVRGVTKAISDLIENINGARALSMQLVEKNINLKKLIAELSIKEKKELGLGNDGGDINNFAASYLNKMINERGNLLNGTGVAEVGEFTDDEMFNALSEGLTDTDRSEDVEKYLKYENRNITTYISVNNDDIEDFNFISKDEEGEIVEDYPVPQVSSISVNRSTNIATDNYGKKYPIIWR